MWYTALGAIVAILVSIASTAVFGRNNPKHVPKELITPFLRKIIFKDEYRNNDNMVSYNAISSQL